MNGNVFMLRKYFATIACLSIIWSLGAAEVVWMTDMTAATAKARVESKNVLINFTGSDWCGFCVKLEREVFATKEFADYADKNLILVKADFPRKKDLGVKQRKANESLKDKYANPFEGYPTLVLVNPSGKKLGSEVGYGGDGPSAVLEKLKSMAKSSSASSN